MSEDRVIYEWLQARMKELRNEFGAEAMDLATYQSYWREAETIKNRHGGMPPTK